MNPSRPSHRISITKACKPLAESSFRGVERWFHIPSNLGARATVELHLSAAVALESATLNLQRLEDRVVVGVIDEEGLPQQAEGGAPENSLKIDYHWDITRQLAQRNHLVLIWPSAVFPSHVFPPWFDLWLEIFELDPRT
jgi:hypothetical protein